MKCFRTALAGAFAASLLSCSSRPGMEETDVVRDINIGTDAGSVAGILASLPLGEENLREVYDAVSTSSERGFDEEYLLSDLFLNPGAGVGGGTRSGAAYATPIRDLFTKYLQEHAGTKSAAGGVDPEEYIAALTESDLQLYFPYHDEVDDTKLPVITFDPGYGAETNIGYEMHVAADGSRYVERVIVDEVMAMERPVWIVNTNDDSAFTPLEFYLEKTRADARSATAVRPSGTGRKLMLKSFRMIRNYDSWFAGASEFKIQIGSVDGFKASTEAELSQYHPSVTDLMVVVKRKYVDQDVPLDGLLMSDFTSQQSKIAFLLIEDDGGTITSWKCSASVKIQSKAYGFDIELPYRDKDDLIWKGQLDADFFREADVVSARFGDTRISFALE